MASLAKIVPYLAALFFFFGQLFRISFQNIDFPLLDVFITILAIINVIFLSRNHNLKISNKYFLYFSLWALASLFINTISHSFSLNSILYLIRILSLISFFIFIPNDKLFTTNFFRFFLLLIFTNIIFGLVQYFIWPDFTYFKSLGWDPHLYRLVSTFFDPTFTGLIYLFFLIIVFQSKITPKSLKITLLLVAYVAIALTYSRSTFLSLFVVSIYLSYINKNLKIALLTTILIISTIFLLPRQPGEGTKLERTSSISAKIENYQEGIRLFTKSPLIGTGYNRLSQVRTDLNQNSNAIGGFDSSLLTILVTTSLPGLLLFVLGLIQLFNSQSSLFQALLLAAIVHSLFANSLIYPWVLLFLSFVYLSKYRT